MRVSLATYSDPALRGTHSSAASRKMLDPRGPSVVLGHQCHADALASPIAPSTDSLFGPRGAAIASDTGHLIVCDTGHHRLLIWNGIPDTDGQAADIVIGQDGFQAEGRNGKRVPGAATLNVPTGVAAQNGVLAVADAWNHRVLIWTRMPERNNQPADIVLGQADFEQVKANRGGDAAGADTLNWCYGVALIGGKLLVADTGNRRVLIWNGLPSENGQPADVVVGQDDFTCRDENAGRDAGLTGMRWPHGLAMIGRRLLVSDAGNNRIMVWDRIPDRPGAPCDFVLGQKDGQSLEHNRGTYLPSAQSLNMPYSLSASDEWLITADTANSRLIGWQVNEIEPDAEARGIAGQPNFTSKGDNRWQPAVRDSLCWPYGLSISGRIAVIADSGNNRVLLWELAG
jgi:hypothetical protein